MWFCEPANARLTGELGTFMRQYGRKKDPHHDPNDRGYDRELERLVKQMDPAELDELLHGDGKPGNPHRRERA